MSKTALRFLAVLLTFLIIVVLAAGLDDLPRSLRDRIDGERKAVAAAAEKVRGARAELDKDVRTEPRLLAAGGLAGALSARLAQADGEMAAASSGTATLAALRKSNRRQDRDAATSLLARVERSRISASAAADSVLGDAGRRIELKRNLPATLRQMEQNRQAMAKLDLGPVAAAVARAGTDWPEKKADLDSRLAALKALPAEAESQWQASAAARRQAEAGDWENLDPAALVAASDILSRNAALLPSRATEIKGLTDQLYSSWDKILVDLEVRRHGESRDYLEKLRTVRTQLLDAAAKKSTTESDEKWVEVSQADFRSVEKNLGMAIEHKSAGRYDTEAERVAQPAGFAYMAPPAQGSNQYGYWDHRGGQSFWVWYGQYALLRDLLFNRDYRPLPSNDYEGYRDARRGGYTYYGRSEGPDAGSGAAKYGTQGSSTQSRYSGSTYMRSGGFRDSQYATRGGGYRDSQFSSPSYRRRDDVPSAGSTPPSSQSGGSGWFSGGSGGSRSFSRPGSSGRSFGSGSRPSRSFGGGGGRRFGGGGRRR